MFRFYVRFKKERPADSKPSDDRNRRFPINLSTKKRIFLVDLRSSGLLRSLFPILRSRPELVDFLLNSLLRNAFFGRSAVVRAFVVTFSNYMQPTRTRRFPMKLSIEKRIFWSICGRPGFCGHIFAKWGSRPELVDFLLNCLLRNAFFDRSAVVRTFLITFLQFWATRRLPVTLCIEKRLCLVDLRSSGF